MKFVPVKVTRTVGRQILVAKKNSPHIFFGAGVIGVIGSTVMACRATLKVSDVLDEIKTDAEDVKQLAEVNHANGVTEYDDGEYQKDLAYVYGRGAVRVVRLYGPAFVVGSASIASLTGAHVSLTRRNAALTAAVAAVTAAYEDYRSRVMEELGPDRELDIYHSVDRKEASVDGKKEIVAVADPNKFSPYARFFDEASTNWTKDPEVNRLQVQSVQNYLNNLLQVRGHVFLNEAYDALGLDRSSAGAVVGWVIGEDGDNYIDFGMFEASERGRAFVNGWERSILLDFNVDGVIYDKI